MKVTSSDDLREMYGLLRDTRLSVLHRNLPVPVQSEYDSGRKLSALSHASSPGSIKVFPLTARKGLCEV